MSVQAAPLIVPQATGVSQFTFLVRGCYDVFLLLSCLFATNSDVNF